MYRPITFLLGSPGAAVMVGSALLAIGFAIFRRWRKAGAFLIIAILTILLRGFVTYFVDYNNFPAAPDTCSGQGPGCYNDLRN